MPPFVLPNISILTLNEIEWLVLVTSVGRNIDSHDNKYQIEDTDHPSSYLVNVLSSLCSAARLETALAGRDVEP